MTDRFKVGNCIVCPNSKDIIEGVIIDIEYGYYYHVLCLKLDEDNQLCVSNTHLDDKDLEDFQLTMIPKFCSIKNLKGILSKYCDKNEEMQLIGFSNQNGSKLSYINNDLKSIYLKTKKEYLEIILCGYGYVWINEFETIEELYFEDINYVLINTDIKIFKDIIGIYLYKDDVKILIGYPQYYEIENSNFKAIQKEYSVCYKETFILYLTHNMQNNS